MKPELDLWRSYLHCDIIFKTINLISPKDVLFKENEGYFKVINVLFALTWFKQQKKLYA